MTDPIVDGCSEDWSSNYVSLRAEDPPRVVSVSKYGGEYTLFMWRMVGGHPMMVGVHQGRVDACRPDAEVVRDAVLQAEAWRLTGLRARGSSASIVVTADELVMLRDRVSAGAEVSEEPGWDALLAKVKAAQGRVTG